jgi:hypothetical protein
MPAPTTNHVEGSHGDNREESKYFVPLHVIIPPSEPLSHARLKFRGKKFQKFQTIKMYEIY